MRGAARATTVEPVREGYARTCARGLAMHLTNPKSIVVWLSVVSLALPTGARQADALAFVLSCATLSATIFCCYALAFSTDAARRAYEAGERWVNAVLAGVFAYAGVRMLLRVGWAALRPRVAFAVCWRHAWARGAHPTRRPGRDQSRTRLSRCTSSGAST